MSERSIGVEGELAALRARSAVLEATLSAFANREHWLERADGRLVWIGTTDAPDVLAALVLAGEPMPKLHEEA